MCLFVVGICHIGIIRNTCSATNITHALCGFLCVRLQVLRNAMQSRIANGENCSFADSSSFDRVVNFMPDVEVISVDPNAYYTSDEDDDYINIDEDTAIILPVPYHQGTGSSTLRLANETIEHESPLMPDNNLFDVIALNINDDLLPDLQYDDIFLTNGRSDESHQFDLASYIDGDTSMLLSPLEVPSMVGRRPFNRASLARQRISFSVDPEEETATKSHLVNSSTQSTVNTNLHNNRIRAKAVPCDIDRQIYVNGNTGVGSNATIATKCKEPATVVQSYIPISVSNETPLLVDAETEVIDIEAEEDTVEMKTTEEETADEVEGEHVINSQIIEEITIGPIKIEEPSVQPSIVDASDDWSMSFVSPMRPPVIDISDDNSMASMPTATVPASAPTLSSIVYSSDDSSIGSTPSPDSNYKASAEVTETSNENSPQHRRSKDETNVDGISQTIARQTDTSTELPSVECKPNTKRKLNIQEYLRRKALKVASELKSSGNDPATGTTESKCATPNTADGQKCNSAGASNRSMYEEIIVVSMGCNTEISIPPPFTKPEHTKMAKSTALLCNIQTAVEKLNSTADTTKLSSSSLISSIQDVILKKSGDSTTSCTVLKSSKSQSNDTKNGTDEEDAELEHGENKVIMHLPRDRIRPMNWSIAIQTDSYFQFPPLELLPPIPTKKATVKDSGDQSRDSQFYSSPSYTSGDGSSSDDSSSDSESSSMSMASESGDSSDYSSSRSHYNDNQRRAYRKRRSSTSSGYNTYGSSKRSTSPGKSYLNAFAFVG